MTAFEDWKGKDGKVNKEALFQRRLAELRGRHDILPWQSDDSPSLEIPIEESKLFADREAEEPELSDEEIERRALLDIVSKTFNFKIFFKRLNYELRRAKRYKRNLSLILVGIDEWSEILAEHGPDSGDSVIAQSGKALLASIRDVDIPGRCREDSFGVILPETPLLGAEIAAERIRTKLEDLSVTHLWKEFTIKTDLGISTFSGEEELEVDELFGAAAESLLLAMGDERESFLS